MNALRFLKVGPLDNLSLARVALPTVSAGEALVRVQAAGINNSDSAGIQGWIPSTSVPRIPGRDWSGEVVKAAPGAEDWIGAEVWGTGGDVGFSSDGSFAQFIKVPVAGLSRKPKSLDHVRAASVGLPWVCAWLAAVTLSEIKSGENVVIIGASGGIGSNAAQLAHERGAKVFGTYRSLADVPPYVTPIDLSQPEPPAPAPAAGGHARPAPGPIRRALTEAGVVGKIDVLLDCAGFETPFNDALGAMRGDGGGRVVVMAVHRPDGLFALDLRTLYVKALTLRGVKSSMLGVAQVKEMLDYVAHRYDAGAFRPPAEPRQIKLEDEQVVRTTLADMLARKGEGKVVIVPDHAQS